MVSKTLIAKARKESGSVVPLVPTGEQHRIEHDNRILADRKELADTLSTMVEEIPQLNGVLNDENKRALVRSVMAIKQAFATAAQSVLDIGRELYELSVRDQMLFKIVTKTPNILPFNEATARKYCRIWEAVAVERSFHKDEIPASVFNAYKVVTWKPEIRALARERGIIRCDIQRAELLRFEAEAIRVERSEKTDNAALRELRFKQARLETKKDELEDELERIEAELVETRALIEKYERPHAVHAMIGASDHSDPDEFDTAPGGDE